MRAAPVLMVLSLACLLGLGVWILTSGGEDGPAPTTAESGEAPESVPEPPSKPSPRVATEDVRPPGPAKEATLRELLSSAISRLPEPEVERGVGLLTGRIVDPEGSPVAGVLVRADPPAPPRGDEDASPTAESLLEDARRARWIRANRRETTTDAEGGFRFNDLARTVYAVTAKHDGFDVMPRAGRDARIARPGAELEFVARPVVVVEVDVVLPDGAAPDAALLECRALGTEGRAWTPQAREFRLPPGQHGMRARIGDVYASGWWRLELDAKSERVSVRLELALRTGIRGRVVYPSDEQSPEAFVVYRRLPAGREVDEVWLTEGGEEADIEQTSLDFRMLDLQPGTYRVGAARHTDMAIEVVEDVVVAEGLAEVTLRVPPLAAWRCARLRVLDPDGASLTNVNLVLHYDSLGRSSGGSGGWVSKPDGSFLLVPEQHGVDGERHSVEIDSQRYGERVVAFEPGAEEEVVVRFEKPGLVRVRVAGYAGSDLEGEVRVFLRPPGESDGSFHVQGDTGNLDEDGETTIGPVQPGPVEVVVAVPEEFGYRPLSATPLTVLSGANLVTVSAPVSYSLTVVSEDGSRGHVVLRSIGKGQPQYHGTRPIGAGGKAVFPKVPPGEYEVKVFGGDKRTITVPDTLEVRF